MAFEFAYEMTFSLNWHHRKHLSCGQFERHLGEQFINTYQGKFAEFGIYQFFSSKGITLSLPDVTIMGKGYWDDTDFKYLNKRISIKSASYFANLLLFECDDWDFSVRYIPDLNNLNNGISDYFFSVECTQMVKP